MNIVYIFLLVLTLISFGFLVPSVFESKKLSKVEGEIGGAQVSAVSSRLKFRFRLFLLIGLVDLVVLFISR